MVHDVFQGVGVVIVAGLHAHHAHCDVGAVVGDTLSVVQHIKEYHAGVDGADAVLQAADVLVAQAFHHHINDLLQRLHLCSLLGIVVFKSLVRQSQNALQCVVQQLQLLFGALAEAGFLVVQLLGLFHDVHGIVADTLELGDKIQQLGHCVALVIAQLLIGQLDQIVGDFHLHAVDQVLAHLDGAHGLLVHFQQQRRGQTHVAGSAAGHLDHRILCLLQSHSRALVQTLVQHRHTQLLCFFHTAGHREHRQAAQHSAARQEQQHGAHAGHGMDVCNGALVHHIAPHGDADGELHCIDQRQQDHAADDVKIQVDECCPLTILGRAADGEQRGERCTDMCTQNDGDGRAEGDKPCAGQCLQNTHGGRRGLDDHGDHHAHQNTQNGVGHGDEQILKDCALPQGCHAGIHQAHAGKQNAEAQHDLADIFLFGIAQEHIKNAANKRHHRGKGLGLDQSQPQAVA